MLTTSDPISKKSLNELHRRRLRVTLWIGSALLVLLGVGWGLYFFTKGAWAVVAIDVAMLAAGIAIALLTRANRPRAAFFLLAGSMLLIICGISLVLDIPTAQAPRSTHHFLLVLLIRPDKI